MVETAESKPSDAEMPVCITCLGRDFSNPPTRLEDIQQLHINEAQPLSSFKLYQYAMEPYNQFLLYPRGYNEGKPFRNPDDFGSNLIGAIISICPNLEVLKVTNTTIPVTSRLTRHLRDWCTKLREFTYLGKACDTSAMAYLVQDVIELEALHVSSVKTCECQGEEAAEEAVELLGKALRDHLGLKRLAFTACRALKVRNGRLLELLGARINANCQAPKYGDLKLESLEFHRCPVPGSALSFYLSTPPAAHLKHLYIGGCKSVKADDLAEAVEKDTEGLVKSDEPLELEIDASLMSKRLFQALKHRITRLRIFEPTFGQYCILTSSIERRFLPRLASLTILPAQGDLAMWDVRGIRFNGTRFIRSSIWSPKQLMEYARANLTPGEEDWCPRWGHLKYGIEKWLEYVGSHAEFSVGDQAWQEMRENRARLAYWKSQGEWEALDLEKYGERRRSVSPSVSWDSREERRHERRPSLFPCKECRRYM